jgi:hypothetical protein
MFTLKINTANAAFDNEGAEIARILRQLADSFAAYPASASRGVEKTEGTLRDINGNTVGKWELK